jgi:transposase InsO family protein
VPLKKKSDAEAEIERWILKMKAMGMRVEALRRDGGREFGSNRFRQWLRNRGIRMKDSAPYTPEQNGLAEKSVDLVCTKARSMLLAIDLPERLWGKAVVTATYLLNRSPLRVLKKKMTPYEAFYGKRPQIQHLRVFGSAAYSRIPNARANGKMTPRGRKLRFMGYELTRIYRLWDPRTGQVSKSRDVEFNENELYHVT